jgi:hypothetical protein
MFKKSKKSHKKKSHIYSINFFYFYDAYDSTFLNWYYNNFGSYFLHPANLKSALRFTLKKVVEYTGIETPWDNTIQFREAKYFAYYRKYILKGKYTVKKRNATRKGMPAFLRVDLRDENDVWLRLKDVHLTTQFKKKFKKQLKLNKQEGAPFVADYDIFKFFVRALTKRYKFKRIPKKIKIKGYKWRKL